MKKILQILISCILCSISFNTHSLEKGKWTLVKDEDWCFIGSINVETDLPQDKNRGDTYILVYKLIGNDENIVQIEAGYNYNLEKDISVKIDNSTFTFYSTKDSPETAWTDDDKKVIYAMKKGLQLILTGESSRGTKTNDVYTLKGFTSAINQLNNDC
tara:strand:+ start:539 stop:1012 length:474 start_codon:yes stop_codon:yes gene_type:complete